MVHGTSRTDGLTDCSEQLIDRVLTAATAVHAELGPGLLETVYRRALMLELSCRGVPATQELPISVRYRGTELGMGFRADVVVDDALLLEIKSVEQLGTVHVAQVINYLKLLNLKRGFLLNFNVPLLKHGIKRVSI
jgi:GxxExxY protein